MKALKAIVFDLDDTLYYERDYIQSGFKAVASWVEKCAGFSTEATLLEFNALMEQGHTRNTFDQWLSTTKSSVSFTASDLVTVYRDHMPDIVPIVGIPQLLRQLREHMRLALLTDGRREQQQRKIDALGFGGEFDCVLLSDSLGKEFWKPSVKPYQVILSQLGVPPESAVYVGDNPLKDFYGARSLGMVTIQVRDPRGLYVAAVPPTHLHAADAIIDSMQLLNKALEELTEA